MERVKIKPIMAFPQFAEWLAAASFTRHGGVSHSPFNTLNTGKSGGDDVKAVLRNRQLSLAALGIEAATLIIPSLAHSDIVSVLSSKTPGLRTSDCDAVVATVSGKAVLMSTADCSPVFFADPESHIAALAHAGWRGIDKGICQNVVDAMKRSGMRSLNNLNAWVGPSIGPCCYRLNQAAQATDPRWMPFVRPVPESGYSIDLWGALYSQLIDCGLQPGNVQMSGICTSCQKDQFFSYYAEKPLTGRFPSILCLK